MPRLVLDDVYQTQRGFGEKKDMKCLEQPTQISSICVAEVC